MQAMPMPNMGHNIFWREDQIIVTFHSSIPLIGAHEVMNENLILKTVDLEAQLSSLNQFLKEQKINYTLSFFEEEVKPPEPYSGQESSPNVELQADNFKPPAGTHLFSLREPIQSKFGVINTSIITFFNFREGTSSSGMTNPASEGDIRSDMDKHVREKPEAVVKIVNGINAGLAELNTRSVAIGAASPVFLCGGTPPVSQGCPLTPPMPVEDDSALWRFSFPQLTPNDLQNMTGAGVTVFILDTLPERAVIENAAQKAGDNNQLLVDVNNNVTFNYNFPLKPIVSPLPGGGSEPVEVGKDVYGKHFATLMPDHGLFIAGIVRDIVPGATIECIRVLNEYCVGDLDILTQALEYIHNRMSQGNDLYQRPVVINMSLVIPTQEELQSEGLILDQSGPQNDVYTPLRQQIQSLVDAGAIIAASAGNEGDVRENPSSSRPAALYPAAFANPPDSLEGIIPVGAVDNTGTVTYSCYPGRRGIATYGGKVPDVTPTAPDPTVPLTVTVDDAARGIYSSGDYPPLVAGDPRYAAPNDRAWAYWVGTSFATPIISALAARILDWQSQGGVIANVHDAVIAAAGTNTTTWDRLDPVATGIAGGSTSGHVILAAQQEY